MLFTPRDHYSNKRVKLQIEKMEIPRGRQATFTVKEIKSGRSYVCKTTSCGLAGCLCDAYIYGYPDY